MKLTYKTLLIVCMMLIGCAPQIKDEEKVQEMLDFLYASMPLPDSVDYPRQFWVDNIECTLRARDEMPWGKTIPEREFRHFVLPVRVNNENMDSSRMVFYEQLKTRLNGMDMEQAVLEVNHWCHEHVTYTPSDERTSSPLVSIRTGYGRCGEESTLLVAALRSVCIPARQVYTPRWAHTDDNHAWVEAWVDGKWHFLGACEPEPVLDLGWFNAPASRSMLMHTKAFGQYDGPEDVMDRTACYTEIAVTSGYAPVKRREVQVVDTEGKPVAGAQVEFKIYNYAEFYTFCTKSADGQGMTSIEAGLGDLVVWAHQGDRYGFAQCRMTEDELLTVTLDHRPGESFDMQLTIVPPRERNTLPQVTEEQRQTNQRRLAEEDSIRNAYIATFPDNEDVAEWAERLGLPVGRIAGLITRSRGNYATLQEFLKDNRDEKAICLLESLSDKDLRDVSPEVLDDHYANTPDNSLWPEEVYRQYILCPRVANEMLTPYRSFLRVNMGDSLSRELAQGGVDTVIRWVEDNISLDEQSNPQNLRMLPSGVYRHRTTDSRSRDIFFVALCRYLSIPARIDGVTGKVQYMNVDSQWVDVLFDDVKQEGCTSRGLLRVEWKPLSWNTDPKYYTHFTLSRIHSGTTHLLNYPEGSQWSNTVKDAQPMDAGDYLLISGTRMADGSVLVSLRCKPLHKGETLVMPLEIREPEEGLQVIGSLNSEALYLPCFTDYRNKSGHNTDDLADIGNTSRSILSTTGRGYYILGFITPDNEPSNHTLRDIAAAREELEQWGGHIVLLFRNKETAARFKPSEFPTLPANTHFGIDDSGIIYEELQRELHLNGTAPTFVIADTFNRVVFLSEGYTIGLGERLARHLDGMKK